MNRRRLPIALLLALLPAAWTIANAQNRPNESTPPLLEGFWTNDTYTPLERPAELGDKEFFTREEAIAFVKRGVDRLLAQARDDIHYDDAIWQAENYSKKENLRTSLIVEPRTGKLPALTPQAQKRLAHQRTTQRAGSSDSAQSRSLAERCITWGNVGPPMIPPTYYANLHIMQTPEIGRHAARADGCGARHLPRWPPPSGAGCPLARRPLGRSLGRRDARRRHDELHRQDELPRVATEHAAGHLRHRASARDRAIHAHGPRHDPLSVHRRGSRYVDARRGRARCRSAERTAPSTSTRATRAITASRTSSGARASAKRQRAADSSCRVRLARSRKGRPHLPIVLYRLTFNARRLNRRDSILAHPAVHRRRHRAGHRCRGMQTVTCNGWPLTSVHRRIPHPRDGRTLRGVRAYGLCCGTSRTSGSG